MAAKFGFSLIWLAFEYRPRVWGAFAYLGTRIRRFSVKFYVSTLPSLLGARYQSKWITVVSGLSIFVFMPAYTSIILIGGARFLQEAMSMDFNTALMILAVIVGVYVLTGGLKAVMYTDAFCSVIMFIGMIFLLIGTYKAVGGVITGHKALTAMKELVPQALTEAGHRGWTAMPSFGSYLVDNCQHYYYGSRYRGACPAAAVNTFYDC